MAEAPETVGSYERIAARLAPVRDELVGRLAPAAGEALLDVATGTGEVAIRAARAGAAVSALDSSEPLLERARLHAAEAGVDVRFERGDAEYLPYDDRSFDIVASNFGLVLAPDHANVSAELARVLREGGRLGFTSWKPDPKVGGLYRRFSEQPLEGREATEWGREDHVEHMLGEEFELEFVDGTLWLEAASGEELWQLFSSSAPPVLALLRTLDGGRGEEFHRAFVELYEGYREGDAIRAPRRYLLVLGRRRVS